MTKNNQLIYCGLALIIFSVASVYITFPLIFHLGNIATGLGDELVIAWIQNWVIHGLTINPFALFDANIYYPYHNSLAFSDLFLTSSILSLIPLKIIGEPIVVVNFTLISSLTLLGFFTWFLIYYLTKDFLLSILGGMLIIFSPATLDKIVHLQILAIQWVPLSILFFIIFTKSTKTRYLILSLIFFILQTYNSFLPGYFILFSYIILCIYIWFYNRKLLLKALSKKNILIIFISFLFLIPVIMPYYKVSNEFKYTRDIREAIHFALQPQDLLYPNQYTRLQSQLTNLFLTKGSFKPGYLGLIFSILSLITLVNFIRSFRKRKLLFNAFNTIALFGLIMSFGPALHFNGETIHHPFPIILPYSIFYYVFPGFQGFRNSARWEMLFLLMIAVAVPLFLFRVFRQLQKWKRKIIYILFITFIIIEYNFPMGFVKMPQTKDFPKVYSWLNNTPKDSKIIEMPIYNWYMQPYVSSERWREYYSTIHFRQMVNGASGFSPPPWQKMTLDILENFPSDNGIKTIKNLHINYVIVHKKEYDLLGQKKFVVNGHPLKSGEAAIEMLSKNKSLKLIKRFDDDYIFYL